MTANPRVSIIIATLNCAEYIERTLTSVLEQSFVDFVHDSCSTDGHRRGRGGAGSSEHQAVWRRTSASHTRGIGASGAPEETTCCSSAGETDTGIQPGWGGA